MVSDVRLPPYATTPEEMVFLNAQALESEYVSNNLHKWIDLIFGYKSGTHSQAIKANNLFHRLTYSHAIKQLIESAEDDVQKE